MAKKSVWYRKQTWTVEDEADFFRKLAKCKSDQERVTNLRIQSAHLSEIPELRPKSIELLKYSISRFPNSDEYLLSITMLARNLALIGDLHEAISFYQRGIEYKNISKSREETVLPIDFALFVIKEDLSNFFELAELTLGEYLKRSPFLLPVDQFHIYGAFALFAAHGGRPSDAQKFAREAFHYAEMKHSGLQNHPRLGVECVKKSSFSEKVASLL